MVLPLQYPDQYGLSEVISSEESSDEIQNFMGAVALMLGDASREAFCQDICSTRVCENTSVKVFDAMMALSRATLVRIN